jgi:hypothetical protein
MCGRDGDHVVAMVGIVVVVMVVIIYHDNTGS